jgi:hypothetical protein
MDTKMKASKTESQYGKAENVGYLENKYISGLSIRDYFAAKAMAALLQSDSHLCIANESYRFADLMLKEREK